MPNRNPRAFTMVEMMFAIMICSIVLLGLLAVLGSVLRNQEEGHTYEKVSIAANIIFSRAGQALERDFDQSLVPDIFAEGRQPVESLSGVDFEISEALVAGRNDLKQVDIAIYWDDKNGVEHKKSMSTKFLRP